MSTKKEEEMTELFSTSLLFSLYELLHSLEELQGFIINPDSSEQFYLY